LYCKRTGLSEGILITTIKHKHLANTKQPSSFIPHYIGKQQGSDWLQVGQVYIITCRHEEAAKSAKFVLENIDSINLTNKPNKSIMVAIRMLFEGMFHLLVKTHIPEEMQ
jgi:hypothetical protein